MKGKIKWVRARMCAGVMPVLDVRYNDRLITHYDVENCPKTVKKFMETATRRTVQMDKLWGEETIYEE